MANKTIVNTEWKDNMKFESDIFGHKLIMDAFKNVGGEDLGPPPKPLILSALAGCSGIDIIMILKKMKIIPEYFNIRIEAELTEENPKYYNKIKMIYEFSENDRKYFDNIEKAINLSEKKYCGVSAQLKCSADISKEIKFVEI